MATALVIYANGSEALEVTTITDVLKRSGVNVTTAALDVKDKIVSLANGTKVICDVNFDDVKNQDFDVIAIPGGLDGSCACRDNSELIAKLKQQKQSHKYIAAICAAPGFVLQTHGLIGDAKVTGYPGCDNGIVNFCDDGAIVNSEHKLITGKGPAYALEFAFAVASVLVDEATLSKVKAGMLHH